VKILLSRLQLWRCFLLVRYLFRKYNCWKVLEVDSKRMALSTSRVLAACTSAKAAAIYGLTLDEAAVIDIGINQIVAANGQQTVVVMFAL